MAGARQSTGIKRFRDWPFVLCKKIFPYISISENKLLSVGSPTFNSESPEQNLCIDRILQITVTCTGSYFLE